MKQSQLNFSVWMDQNGKKKKKLVLAILNLDFSLNIKQKRQNSQPKQFS